MRPASKPSDKRYSEKEMADILTDALDPNRTQVVCKRHSYVGAELPPAPIGCADCWQAYWMHKIASTPPHLRQQRLEEAYRAVYDAVKSHERGEFDFDVLDHAITEIHKDAEPD